MSNLTQKIYSQKTSFYHQHELLHRNKSSTNCISIQRYRQISNNLGVPILGFTRKQN